MLELSLVSRYDPRTLELTTAEQRRAHAVTALMLALPAPWPHEPLLDATVKVERLPNGPSGEALRAVITLAVEQEAAPVMSWEDAESDWAPGEFCLAGHPQEVYGYEVFDKRDDRVYFYCRVCGNGRRRELRAQRRAAVRGAATGESGDVPG